MPSSNYRVLPARFEFGNVLPRSLASILLAVIVTAGGYGAAAGGYRIKRQNDGILETNTLPGGSTESKPLIGKVDLNVSNASTESMSRSFDESFTDSLVDPSQFRGTPLEGRPALGGLKAGAERFQTGHEKLKTGLMGGRAVVDINRKRLQGDVSDSDLRLLGDRDVVVMQDCSSSMRQKEFFPGHYGMTSRWRWCLSQTSDLTRQTAAIADWGVTLVMFAGQYDVYNNVRLLHVPEIYQQNRPYFGTLLAQPLSDQLERYFLRRARGNTRPLLVAVITDGKPQDNKLLCDVIVNATSRMKNPDEISITFLEVGTDMKSRRRLGMLDSGLSAMGARYDIVNVMPFNDVVKDGLTRALVHTIQKGS